MERAPPGKPSSPRIRVTDACGLEKSEPIYGAKNSCHIAFPCGIPVTIIAGTS